MSGEEEGREKENGEGCRVSLRVLCKSAQSAPITILELVKQQLGIHQSLVSKSLGAKMPEGWYLLPLRLDPRIL